MSTEPALPALPCLTCFPARPRLPPRLPPLDRRLAPRLPRAARAAVGGVDINCRKIQIRPARCCQMSALGAGSAASPPLDLKAGQPEGSLPRAKLASSGHRDAKGWEQPAAGTVRSRAGALNARPTLAIAVLPAIRQLVPG